MALWREGASQAAEERALGWGFRGAKIMGAGEHKGRLLGAPGKGTTGTSKDCFSGKRKTLGT